MNYFLKETKDELKDKLKEKDVEKIGVLLRALAWANKEVAGRVAKKILESDDFMKMHRDDEDLVKRLKRLAKGIE